MSKQTLEQVLDNFQNGEQRYDKDGYFREAITSLHAGVGVYAVLDRVLKELTILMRLHNEQTDKNRVAVGEVARLSGENDTLISKIRLMSDELDSYKDALQLARGSRKL